MIAARVGVKYLACEQLATIKGRFWYVQLKRDSKKSIDYDFSRSAVAIHDDPRFEELAVEN